MKLTNRWNQFIYRLWAPIYDSTVNHVFMPGRKRALELLALRSGERVIIVGVGTGADFPLLPQGVDATGVDLSPDMLAKARLKLDRYPVSVKLIQGDAQTLLVDEAAFDLPCAHSSPLDAPSSLTNSCPKAKLFPPFEIFSTSLAPFSARISTAE
jgi:phosphatidylethanolamine/phosphatidyl-N-methylethanolamine N-methyltransferase